MSLVRTIVTTALAGVALGLVACGGESDEDQVKAVANQLAKTDEKVCDNATDKFLKAVGGTKEQCKKSAREDDGSTKPKVGKITVDGDKATAVLSVDGSKATFGLIKDGDQWKLDSVR
jgi:hypothetical protein